MMSLHTPTLSFNPISINLSNTTNNFPNLTNNTLTSNHISSLNIGSINANLSLKKNISLYIDFIKKENIDILCIQEPGPFISNESTSSTTNDINSPYEIRSNNLISFTNWHPDNRYSLITLCQSTYISIIKKNPTINSHIQSLTLQSEIGPISIINTYISHDSTTSKETIAKLNTAKELNNHTIICGDLNSYPSSNLDYFNNSASEKRYIKYKIKTFNTIAHNMSDSFRFLNPLKKSFTKWTINTEKNPPSVTATRLDHCLISNHLTTKLKAAKIYNNNPIPSDHSPISISLNLKKPKAPKKANLQNPNPPHYTLWPLSLHINIENDLKSLQLNPISNSTEMIEHTANSLTKIIQQNWKQYVDSLPKINTMKPNYKRIKKNKKIKKKLTTSQ